MWIVPPGYTMTSAGHIVAGGPTSLILGPGVTLLSSGHCVDNAPVFVPPLPETLALAREAVRACEARKNDDVQAWASRLAADVGHLTD